MVTRLSYEVGGLGGDVHEVRVRRAVVERAEFAGASIVSAQGTGPTAALVASPAGVDEASNVSAFDGAVSFEMTGEPVWPATIELPVDMAEVQDDDFIFLMSFNEELGVWLPEPGAVFDAERGVVTAEVHHLSDWFTKKVRSIGSGIRGGASAAVSGIREVGRGFLDTVDTAGEVIVEPIVNTVDMGIEGIRTATKYVWDRTSAGVIYVVEKGRTFVVNTYAVTREAALVAARAAWEATKLAVAMSWEALNETVAAWFERLAPGHASCDDTQPAWVAGVELPERGAPVAACAEAVSADSSQDLRLKVAAQRLYPMLFTAIDPATHKKINISTGDDPGRVRIEKTEGGPRLGEVIAAWHYASYDSDTPGLPDVGTPLLPASATHWIRIPRSALADPLADTGSQLGQLRREPQHGRHERRPARRYLRCSYRLR
ncbi:hypothetical protein [Candidatus Poriferisodalis sp.]|uniref:hypothetical protein n=1 Tax=Candidatus Poriferisodalis sp. TaxID=3101277 RepID=UPI003B01CF77